MKFEKLKIIERFEKEQMSYEQYQEHMNPWGKKEHEEEMETHEQYLSMAGIMYESIKENWKKTGRKKEIIKEMQQKIIEILFRKMPEFLEHRQKCIKTKEIQDGYKRNKTQYKMTKDGKAQRHNYSTSEKKWW